MKKCFFKHFIHFTTAMSLWAAILAVTPSDAPPETGGSISQASIEEPKTEKNSENNPEISPQNDRELENMREN